MRMACFSPVCCVRLRFDWSVSSCDPYSQSCAWHWFVERLRFFFLKLLMCEVNSRRHTDTCCFLLRQTSHWKILQHRQVITEYHSCFSWYMIQTSHHKHNFTIKFYAINFLSLSVKCYPQKIVQAVKHINGINSPFYIFIYSRFFTSVCDSKQERILSLNVGKSHIRCMSRWCYVMFQTLCIVETGVQPQWVDIKLISVQTLLPLAFL